MTKLKTGLALAALTLVAGCASASHDNERWPQVPAPAPAAPPPAYQPPAPPVYQPPVPVPQAQAQSPAQSSPAYRNPNDQCNAAALQYLVGRPRTEIPVPLQPSTRRVVCSSCVMTHDFRADRQTIIFDSDSGLIKSVTCG